MGEMNVRELNDRLVEYLYGELEGEQREAFEAGLRRHPEVQLEVDSLQRTRTAFGEMRVLEPPMRLTEQILREAAARAPGREAVGWSARLRQALRFLLAQPALPVVAMLVVVLGIGLYAYHRSAPIGHQEPRGLVGKQAAPLAAQAPGSEGESKGEHEATLAEAPAASGGREADDVAEESAESHEPLARDEARRSARSDKAAASRLRDSPPRNSRLRKPSRWVDPPPADRKKRARRSIAARAEGDSAEPSDLAGGAITPAQEVPSPQPRERRPYVTPPPSSSLGASAERPAGKSGAAPDDSNHWLELAVEAVRRRDCERALFLYERAVLARAAAAALIERQLGVCAPLLARRETRYPNLARALTRARRARADLERRQAASEAEGRGAAPAAAEPAK